MGWALWLNAPISWKGSSGLSLAFGLHLWSLAETPSTGKGKSKMNQMEQEQMLESPSPLPVIPRLDRMDRLVTCCDFSSLLIYLCSGHYKSIYNHHICSCIFWKRSIARRESDTPDKANRKMNRSRHCPLHLRKYLTKAPSWSEWQSLRIEFYRQACLISYLTYCSA